MKQVYEKMKTTSSFKTYKTIYHNGSSWLLHAFL